MSSIKNFCQNLGIRPSKKKGQNFLVNEKILDDIIKAAEIKSTDIILEIGPGFGNLTEKLAQKAKRVVAIEIDRKLAEFLKEKFSAKGGSTSGGKNQENIEIIQADILKIENWKLKIENYKVVANLPYHITGAVLCKFLASEFPKPKLMVLMLQKEVAERIVEKNGKRSIISLMVNFYGKPEIVRYVSKNNFWPKPKVESALLKISRIGTNLPRINTNLFFKIIKIGFSSPRKQLLNNLKKIVEKSKLEKILEKAEINPQIRAEDLTLKDWLNIYKYLHQYRTPSLNLK